jgi:hypothetical protein
MEVFMMVNKSVKEVGKIIGGKVEVNINSGDFKNACPIRMSYVLNKMGFPIQYSRAYVMVSGQDKKVVYI